MDEFRSLQLALFCAVWRGKADTRIDFTSSSDDLLPSARFLTLPCRNLTVCLTV
jgi:hypothetical protein